MRVCLSGKTAFTEQQYDTAVLLVKNIMERYKLTEKDIYCHYQFDSCVLTLKLIYLKANYEMVK